MHSGGGEYNLDNHQPCLSDQDRLVILDEIKENLKSLKNQNIITKRILDMTHSLNHFLLPILEI